MAMSDGEPADREEIRLLMARYNINGDRARVAELAATFIENGVLSFPGNRLEGRAAITDMLGGTPGTPRARDPRHSFTRHNLTTSLVEIDGDSATGRTYFMVMTNIGLDHSGHYADHLVKVDGAWRFASRDVRIDWVSPESFNPALRERAKA